MFPLLDQGAVVVPYAYVVGIEEAANNHFQDLVYIVRNVMPYVPSLPGDFNNDGTVGAADYVLWRNNDGQAIALPNETETPGMVTMEDYETWRANFGAVAATGARLALPVTMKLGEVTIVTEPDEIAPMARTAAFTLLGEVRATETASVAAALGPTLFDLRTAKSVHDSSTARHATVSRDRYFSLLLRRAKVHAARSSTTLDAAEENGSDLAVLTRTAHDGELTTAIDGSHWQTQRIASSPSLD